MGCNCTKSPPPEELKAAVGTWRGANAEGATVTFVLLGEGSFYYARNTGNTSVSMQGPINKWSGGSFDSKPCCFCSWHFELDKPVDSPEEGLTMDVNGVKLSYVGAPSVPGT
jgi:hypothetical protein